MKHFLLTILFTLTLFFAGASLSYAIDADFDVSVSGMTVSVDASKTTPSKDQGYIYRWSFDWVNNDSVNTSGKTATYEYDEAGTYTIYLRVEDITQEGNPWDSLTKSVTIVDDGERGGGVLEEARKHGAGGIVPCNGPDCGFNEFVSLGNNIIGWLIRLALVFATASFAFAGYLYMTSGGDSGKVSRAHSVFKKTAIGLIIVLLAWLIVDTILDALLQGSGFKSLLE